MRTHTNAAVVRNRTEPADLRILNYRIRTDIAICPDFGTSDLCISVDYRFFVQMIVRGYESQAGDIRIEQVF